MVVYFHLINKSPPKARFGPTAKSKSYLFGCDHTDSIRSSESKPFVAISWSRKGSDSQYLRRARHLWNSPGNCQDKGSLGAAVLRRVVHFRVIPQWFIWNSLQNSIFVALFVCYVLKNGNSMQISASCSKTRLFQHSSHALCFYNRGNFCNVSFSIESPYQLLNLSFISITEGIVSSD